MLTVEFEVSFLLGFELHCLCFWALQALFGICFKTLSFLRLFVQPSVWLLLRTRLLVWVLAFGMGLFPVRLCCPVALGTQPYGGWAVSVGTVPVKLGGLPSVSFSELDYSYWNYISLRPDTFWSQTISFEMLLFSNFSLYRKTSKKWDLSYQYGLKAAPSPTYGTIASFVFKTNGPSYTILTKWTNLTKSNLEHQ